MFLPTGRAINPITKTNWEGTGVNPDIQVPAIEALKAAHLDAVRKIAEKMAAQETREPSAAPGLPTRLDQIRKLIERLEKNESSSQAQVK
jgi:hypothetical protein